MIAALHVESRGVYAGLPDVDLWDRDRDARTYAGPWPVIAHPPYARWGRSWGGHPTQQPLLVLGDDEGCFAAALDAVRRHGGIAVYWSTQRQPCVDRLRTPHTTESRRVDRGGLAEWVGRVAWNAEGNELFTRSEGGCKQNEGGGVNRGVNTRVNTPQPQGGVAPVSIYPCGKAPRPARGPDDDERRARPTDE